MLPGWDSVVELGPIFLCFPFAEPELCATTGFFSAHTELIDREDIFAEFEKNAGVGIRIAYASFKVCSFFKTPRKPPFEPSLNFNSRFP